MVQVEPEKIEVVGWTCIKELELGALQFTQELIVFGSELRVDQIQFTGLETEQLSVPIRDILDDDLVQER